MTAALIPAQNQEKAKDFFLQKEAKTFNNATTVGRKSKRNPPSFCNTQARTCFIK
ncbi:hypothetical protein [Acidiphilium acidophilum]|uniref:Uncharacterized protein n=1 Tax=Acidiphilium acidophilum TaxID=76588 RepID=A0AAW9DQB0_ACIAO|nr:hypothetical protein [Acidiphilium acidophilum]MDX5930237.1 hypothetical protein [Acidiphilium acidophilum]